MRKTAVFAFFLGISLCASGQSAWEYKVLPGFLIPHHTSMAEMQAHIVGLELGREWRLDSAGFLDKRMHHPYAGFAVNYFDLGKDINGKSISAQMYCEVGTRPIGKVSIRFRLSSGIGYLTEKFNIYNNTLNRAIGTHINGFMQIMAYAEMPLVKRAKLDFGIGMSHYSNGNWGQPNLGINLPSLVLGVKQLDRGTKHLNLSRIITVPPLVKYQISGRLGRRQISIDDSRSALIYILEGIVQYPLSEFRMLRLGLVGFYDRTYSLSKFQPMPTGVRMKQNSELAIQLGHEFRIGRIGMATDFGVYLYRPERTKRGFYEGLAIKYYVTQNFCLINRLKAHLTSADYFEWGIGYSLSGNKLVRRGMRGIIPWITKKSPRHSDAF